MLLLISLACIESEKNDDASYNGPYNIDAPEVEWYVGQGTDVEEHVHEGMQTSDGGYIGIGETQESSNDDGMGDILIIKTDASGNLEWQERFGTEGVRETGIAIVETEDGGFVAGLGLAVDGQMQPALMALSPSGEMLWTHTYPDEGYGSVRGLQLLDSGEIVATGYRKALDGGFQFVVDEGEGFIMKTDSEGDVIWDSTLDITQGTKLRLADDGGFMVLSTGWIFEDDEDRHAPILVKTTSEGQQEWKKSYASNGMSQAFDFDQTTDGGYVLAGHTTGYGSVNWDCLMIRTDAEGNLLWEQTFGNPRGYNPEFIHDECYGIRQTPDGGFVMAGGSGDEYDYSEDNHPAGSSDEWKAYVVKTDANGDLEWEAIYDDGPDNGNNAAEYIGLTDDGGYILFNDSDSTGEMTPNNFGFMKLSPE